MPASFPLNLQYIKAVKDARAAAAAAKQEQGVAAADEEEEELSDEESEKPKRGKKKPSKRVSNKKHGSKKGETQWNYGEIRTKFIKQARVDGLNFTAAKDLWDESQAKRDLLGPLTLPELKRRKFVDKDCQSNPWAVAP